jgi:hypothetical protein
VYPCVAGEFRVECGNQMFALFDKDRISMIFGEHLYSGARAPDDGGADENGFNITRPGALLKLRARFDSSNPAIDLSTVGIAFDRHIDDAEAFLRGVLHVGSEQNGPGAGAEDGLLLREPAQRLLEIHVIQELEHGGALAAGDYQTVEIVELFGGSDLHSVGTGASEGALVGFEIALQGEDADAFVTSHGWP